MATYRVKEGHKAFINSALREGGYTFTKEQALKELPDHLEEVTGASAKKAAPASAKKVAEPVSFADVDLTETPTVQL